MRYLSVFSYSKSFRFAVSLIASILFAVSLNAQTLVDVAIEVPSDVIEVPEILIGEQALLHVTVTSDKGKQLIIPIPQEQVTEGIEVLSLSKLDTTDIKNNRQTIKFDVLITSFEPDTLFLLPPFVAIDGNDTIYSNQVALKVTAPEVNLARPDEYYDIKNVWKPPFVLADYYGLSFGILFVLLLIAAAWYFYPKLRRSPQKAESVKAEPSLPPHVQAIKELREIRERKLWQQGRSKEYYTEVTDTLRRYISARYGESAMERTSSEILEIMRNEEPGNKEVYDTLKQILQLSDFVKFAKLNPLPDENELSMFNANLFVDKTKQEPLVTPASPQTPELTATE